LDTNSVFAKLNIHEDSPLVGKWDKSRIVEDLCQTYNSVTELTLRALRLDSVWAPH
jgi:hypothetical protein